MDITEMNTGTSEKNNRLNTSAGFYSVEFCVEEPHPLYQFKLWRSDTHPMFVVVKENSAVLPKLKSGSILNMTYYSSDTRCPRTQIETRIGSINNENCGRFEGHCTIDLLPVVQSNITN
ncbi:MAG: hypothetical protein CSA23_00770 [Deltaproteobacteria bacterium]|nr:MAG: hypothetical protein CSA23_00770 [Deltaproteobacteria bacterium]